MCCSPWGLKEFDMIEQLNWTDWIHLMCWSKVLNLGRRQWPYYYLQLYTYTISISCILLCGQYLISFWVTSSNSQNLIIFQPHWDLQSFDLTTSSTVPHPFIMLLSLIKRKVTSFMTVILLHIVIALAFLLLCDITLPNFFSWSLVVLQYYTHFRCVI